MNNQINHSNRELPELNQVAFKMHPSEWSKVEALLLNLEQLEASAFIEAYKNLVQDFENGNPSQEEPFIFALKHRFESAFGKTPIRLDDNSRLVFGTAIVYDNGTYREVHKQTAIKLNDQSRLSNFVQ